MSRVNTNSISIRIASIEELIGQHRAHNARCHKGHSVSNTYLNQLSRLMQVVKAILPLYASKSAIRRERLRADTALQEAQKLRSLLHQAKEREKLFSMENLTRKKGSAERLSIQQKRYEIAEILETPIQIVRGAANGENIPRMTEELLTAKMLLDAVAGLEETVDDAEFTAHLKRLKDAIDAALQVPTNVPKFNFSSQKSGLTAAASEMEKKVASWRKPIPPHPLFGHIMRTAHNAVVEKLVHQIQTAARLYAETYQKLQRLKRLKLPIEDTEKIKSKVDTKRQIRDLTFQVEALKKEIAKLKGRPYHSPWLR